MQIRKTTVLEDQTLRQTFQRCVDEVVSPLDQDTVNLVYSVLLAKVFNARCNEYLRAVSTEATQKDNKTVDVHVGLRDKLKTFAAAKQL